MSCHHPVVYKHLESGAYLVVCDQGCGWEIGPGGEEWAKEVSSRINGYRERAALQRQGLDRRMRKARSAKR